MYRNFSLLFRFNYPKSLTTEAKGLNDSTYRTYLNFEFDSSNPKHN